MVSNIIQRRTVFTAVISAALLAACAQPQRTTNGPVNAVVGTVDFQERVTLPPQAVLVVELQDTSRTDAAAQVISQQSIKIENLQPPFKFIIPVEPSRLNPAAQYTVSARITTGSQPLFINDILYPVLTRGAGQTANILLVRAVP